jgi:hypothetical protein
MIQRTVLTSIGHITVQRRYYNCLQCDQNEVSWDQWAGIDHRNLTPQARRMLALAGMSWSFDVAAERLKELCHLQTSNDTIRRVCDEEGERVRQFLGSSSEATASLKEAQGHPEFYSDGVTVNTTEGWREMRLSVVARRRAGAPCEAKQWDQRVLPEPTARLAVCAVANCQRVGASWQRLMERVDLKNAGDLSVIADGAKWIWEQAARRLSPHAKWVVDIYHVSEHLHDCGKALHGEGEAARDWAERQLMYLLEQDGVALVRRLRQEQGVWEGAKALALEKLLHYLEDNQDRMWYRQRLREGLPIGSGLIEGACKTVVAARLKINSARWRIRRAERMGALRCLDYSGLWNRYWDTKAA